MIKLLLITFCSFALTAEARVFDFTKERFASYLMGGLVQSSLADKAWAKESSAATFNANITYLQQGEFGFILNYPTIAFLMGLEIIQTPALASVDAKDAAGTVLYSFKNELQVYTPKFGIQLPLYREASNRTYFLASYGTGTLTHTKTYSGSTIAPLGSHVVEAKATANLMSGGVGYEKYFGDTNTFAVEFGYRKYDFVDPKYSSNVTTFAGTVASGDVVRDTDGNYRDLNLSGYYVSLALRIYIL